MRRTALKRSIKYIVLKSLIFLGVYALFHFGYEIVPLPIFISSESIWEHLKGGFFTATLIALAEIFLRNKLSPKISFRHFLMSRLSGILSVPLIIFILYYTLNSWTGKLDNSTLEMIIAISVTILSAVIAYLIENELLELDSPILFYITLGLFIFLAYLFILFTYELPFYPLFEPVE